MTINKQLLNSLDHQNGPMIVTLIATLLHFPLSYMISYYFEIGKYGPAIAFSITGVNNFLFLHVYTSFLKDYIVK
jgi:Na+-driven multidrug efflux pump